VNVKEAVVHARLVLLGPGSSIGLFGHSVNEVSWGCDDDDDDDDGLADAPEENVILFFIFIFQFKRIIDRD